MAVEILAKLRKFGTRGKGFVARMTCFEKIK